MILRLGTTRLETVKGGSSRSRPKVCVPFLMPAVSEASLPIPCPRIDAEQRISGQTDRTGGRAHTRVTTPHLRAGVRPRGRARAAWSSREEVRTPEVPGARGGGAARRVGRAEGGGREKAPGARGPLSGGVAQVLPGWELSGESRGQGSCGRPLLASDWGVTAGPPPCCAFRPVSHPSGWWERSSCRRRSFSWSGHPSGISSLWPTRRAR